MRRLLLALAALLLVPTAALAQSGGGVISPVAFPLTGPCGTVSTSQICLNLTVSWPTTGTYLAPITLSVVDTGPANAASQLLNLSGGASGTTMMFAVDKSGGTTLAQGTMFAKNPTGFFIAGTTSILGWTTNSAAGTSSTIDTALSRGAAGELDCGNGTQGDKSCKFVAASHQVGSGTVLTLSAGELGFNKITATGVAAGAAGGKMELVCGTNAGSAKLIVYAGTSTTAVTLLDNIGTGVTGC